MKNASEKGEIMKPTKEEIEFARKNKCVVNGCFNYKFAHLDKCIFHILIGRLQIHPAIIKILRDEKKIERKEPEHGMNTHGPMNTSFPPGTW